MHSRANDWDKGGRRMSQVIFILVNQMEQIKEVVSLAERVWREHYSEILDQGQIEYMLERFQSEKAIREQIEHQGYQYYLLQADGAYAGFIGIKEEPQNKSLFLSKIYIDKEYRGLGYGSQSFAFLIDICKRKQYNKIWLTVNRQNKSSIRIYEKNGFRKAYTKVSDIGHGYVMDDYIMEKMLENNKEKKILFFDIDGTLLAEDTHIVPETAIRGLRKAKENGHLIYINTGRTYSALDRSIQTIGFNGYVCGCGTYIQTGEDILLSRSIEEKECRRIIKLLRMCRVDAVLEGQEDLYFDNYGDIDPDIESIKMNFALHGLGIKKTWDDEIIFDKFFCKGHKDSDMITFRKELEKDYELIDRNDNLYEIVPRGYSKATGIEFLLNYHKIPLEDAFAFGDSSNDLSMLNYVPNSIAMGQGEESALKAASFVTKGIHEDGIEYALKHFGII